MQFAYVYSDKNNNRISCDTNGILYIDVKTKIDASSFNLSYDVMQFLCTCKLGSDRIVCYDNSGNKVLIKNTENEIIVVSKSDVQKSTECFYNVIGFESTKICDFNDDINYPANSPITYTYDLTCVGNLVENKKFELAV